LVRVSRLTLSPFWLVVVVGGFSGLLPGFPALFGFSLVLVRYGSATVQHRRSLKPLVWVPFGYSGVAGGLAASGRPMFYQLGGVVLSGGGPGLRVGVCGVACEACPRMVRGACPGGEAGCRPRERPFCRVATCSHRRGVELCFGCPDFPCETTRLGPVDYGFCRYIAGREV